MDLLDEYRIKKIQGGWQRRVESLLKMPIAAVFYDTTTCTCCWC